MSEDSVVSVRGLVKVYHDFWRRPTVRAVDGVDLAIRAGEIFGLLGPNGSGKSTTIKSLLGLLRPTAGSLRVLGCPPSDVRAKQRIGYLPEESCLYNHLTAHETLDLYARLFPMDPDTRRTRVRQLVGMMGLDEAVNRPLGEFSKGMARRVGIAQSLVNDPDLIFFDEPTSGLDPLGCRQIKDLMLSLRERGKTIVLSSHLLADVEDVCDRITILYGGRILAEGRVNELLEEQERVRLTFPTLPPAEMKALLAAVKQRIGSEPELDHPSMNLERFFVDVIKQAQVRPVEVADYLKS